MSIKTSLKKITHVSGWGRLILWLVILWIISGLISWSWNWMNGSSPTKNGVEQTTSSSNSSWNWFAKKQWVTVQTVTYAPDGKLYNQGGWQKVPLEAGKYRLQVTKTTYAQSVGMNEHEGFRKVPIRGIPLSYWNNQPFQAEFINHAPVPTLGVGAVVVQLGQKRYPGEVLLTLPKNETIGLGVNLLPYYDNYSRNAGEITVAIQKEIME